jgi:uncharacterized protein YlaI
MAECVMRCEMCEENICTDCYEDERVREGFDTIEGRRIRCGECWEGDSMNKCTSCDHVFEPYDEPEIRVKQSSMRGLEHKFCDECIERLTKEDDGSDTEDSDGSDDGSDTKDSDGSDVVGFIFDGSWWYSRAEFERDVPNEW